MVPTSHWNGKLAVPDALLLSHNDARAELVRAALEGGRIAAAAKRVARLCLPHFEFEEKCIFPVLALLPYLTRRKLQPEMTVALQLIADFRAKHDALHEGHEAILFEIEALLHAAQKENNREFVEFAYSLRIHEMIEEEVIYPTIILIGDYLQEKFSN